MRRLAILTVVGALAACSASEPAEQNVVPAARNAHAETSAARANSEMPPLPRAAATPTKTLAAELLGVWTADKRGDCAAGNPLRIEIAPTRITFHESVAEIESAVKTWPEGYGVDAQLTGEGKTERRSFDLIPRGDGTLTRSEAPFPDITYTRCKGQA